MLLWTLFCMNKSTLLRGQFSDSLHREGGSQATRVINYFKHLFLLLGKSYYHVETCLHVQQSFTSRTTVRQSPVERGPISCKYNKLGEERQIHNIDLIKDCGWLSSIDVAFYLIYLQMYILAKISLKLTPQRVDISFELVLVCTVNSVYHL